LLRKKGKGEEREVETTRAAKHCRSRRCEPGVCAAARRRKKKRKKGRAIAVQFGIVQGSKGGKERRGERDRQLLSWISRLRCRGLAGGGGGREKKKKGRDDRAEVTALLPKERPRKPDGEEGKGKRAKKYVLAGSNMMDCVLPTRSEREKERREKEKDACSSRTRATSKTTPLKKKKKSVPAALARSANATHELTFASLREKKEKGKKRKEKNTNVTFT